MADALVEPGDEMTLLITNCRAEPVQLEVGEVVRRLQPARVVKVQDVGGDCGRNAEDGGTVLEVVDGGVRVKDGGARDRESNWSRARPTQVCGYHPSSRQMWM